ncbi:MAG: glycosyltransferase family 2 protein [Candidatus Sumerlaeota bacterium]|nr:glycosyltransferase family 2 protein [Candidatus Sumerlaeota bacterium]
MSLFVCLPCFNEERSLPPLLEKFAALKERLSEPLQLIAVDDGSADKTQSVLRESAKILPLQVVVHERNHGLGPAIISGLRAALALSKDDGDAIVCMDADDTHDPDYIPLMMERMRAGADVVIASRYQSGSRQVGVPFFRAVLSAGARLIFRFLLPIPGVRDYTCGYRAYRAGLLRRAMDVFGERLIERRGFACTDEILIKLSALTSRIEEIPFILRYDQKRGRSSLPLFETILATIKLIHHGRRLRKQAMKTVKRGV